MLRDRWGLPAFRFKVVRPAGPRRWQYPRANAAAGGRLPGRDAECFGVGPAVVLGQDLAEVAGPVRHGVPADLATGDRQSSDGHGEAAGR
jgi:hypothetical protein